MYRLYGSQLLYRLKERFERLYGDAASLCLKRAIMMVGRYGQGMNAPAPAPLWDEADTLLITYPDMLDTLGERPLQTLYRFLSERLRESFGIVHILPFFPFSADDGYAIEDFRNVRPGLGNWGHIHRIGEDFSLMFDLVLNHVSRHHPWVKDYREGIAPGRDFFIETDPTQDLSMVVRPRDTPLLTRLHTNRGARYLWTTFSSEQIDLNFGNPDVLFEFLDLLLHYVRHGACIIRLDAIAYVWKKPGTPCIHLPETHELVKLLRDFLEICAPRTILLTETNVPQRENLSYFGDGDEAHMVYQFPLPPLLLHTLLRENAALLTEWAKALPEPPSGCTWLNFTASHDGIGLRPVEDILAKDEILFLVRHCRKQGGRITTRRRPDGSQAPYELNITYFDAMGTGDSSPVGQRRKVLRFICSQLISMELRGIPAIYFNSLVAASNDLERVKKLGYPRAINRTKWQERELLRRLSSRRSVQQVFRTLTHALRVRRRHAAFHPDAYQQILDFGKDIFAVQRTALDGRESILCLSNVTRQRRVVHLERNRQHDFRGGPWRCALSERPRGQHDRVILAPYETVWLVRGRSSE